MNLLKVHCEFCSAEYEVKREKSQAKQFRILDFAVCPNGHPRRPHLYEEYHNNWTCKECGVPEPFVTPKNKDICEPCYFSSWYVKRVAKNGLVVHL